MLNSEQIRQLERIKNRSTKYEIVLQKGGETYLLLYATGGRRNRRSLVEAIGRRAAKITKLTGATDYQYPARGSLAEIDLNGWIAKFSGRTQRDAIMLGEFTFIEDLFAEPEKAAA